MVKFKDSDKSLASTCDIASTRSKFVDSGKSMSQDKLSDIEIKDSTESTNKFKLRAEGEDDKICFSKPLKSKFDRYRNESNSSFLNDILNGSSSIFSFRSPKRKTVMDVRKKYDQAKDYGAIILFNESDQWNHDKSTSSDDKNNPKMKHQNYVKNSEDDSLINIDKEIDWYLDNDKSLNLIDHKSINSELERNNAEICFADANPQNHASYESIPAEPNIPKVDEEESKLDEMLNQIVMVSQMIRPSDDDLAQRILSNQNIPFSVNFNIHNNLFEVNLKLVPRDRRCEFIATEDFKAMALNHDTPAEIKRNDVLKVLSCDGKSHAFGFKIDKSFYDSQDSYEYELVMIPFDKITAKLSKYPYSAKRNYEINDWNLWNENTTEEDSYNLPSLTNSVSSMSCGRRCSEVANLIYDALDKNVKENVQDIGFFETDFNNDPMTISISKQINEKINSLNILSAEQGDIICITRTNSNHKWVEGYLAKDPSRTLGLVHLTFINKIFNP